MKARLAAACAILLSLGTSTSAHRLDEYLQATNLSVEKDHVQARLRLIPGVAVFPTVFASIDTNADRVLSATEQQAYAEQVLHDLSLTMDGHALQLRLVSWEFAKTSEMKEGRGDIQLDFHAEVLPSGRNRKLVFENHHQSRIAVYLVNCLVPRDPDIHVTAQHRNYQQSRYELDYVQADIPPSRPLVAWWTGIGRWLSMTILLMCAPLVGLWRRVRVGKETRVHTQNVSTCKHDRLTL